MFDTIIEVFKWNYTGAVPIPKIIFITFNRDFKKTRGGRGPTPLPPLRFPGPVCTLVLLFLPGHHTSDLSHGYRHSPGEGDLFWDHQKF